MLHKAVPPSLSDLLSIILTAKIDSAACRNMTTNLENKMPSPQSSEPVVMACNDNKVRVIDVEDEYVPSDPESNTSTNVRSGELSGHCYPLAVNCTGMCPGGKLRSWWVIRPTFGLSTRRICTARSS